MADAKAEGNLRIVRTVEKGPEYANEQWFVGFYRSMSDMHGGSTFEDAARHALRIGPRKPEPKPEQPRDVIEVAPAEAAYKPAPTGPHSLPEDYLPTTELVARAKRDNPDMTDEAIAARTMAFKDYYLGEGTGKRNWNYVWLGFIRITRADERR